MRIALIVAALSLIVLGCSREPAPRLAGVDLYLNYCAACHGANGEGEGPVASVMKIQVPNLRVLSQRNDGSFPEEAITEYIDGRTSVVAHGDRQMPIWGDVFRWENDGDPSAEQRVAQRIAAIVEFLKEFQY